MIKIQLNLCSLLEEIYCIVEWTMVMIFLKNSSFFIHMITLCAIYGYILNRDAKLISFAMILTVNKVNEWQENLSMSQGYLC